MSPRILSRVLARCIAAVAWSPVAAAAQDAVVIGQALARDAQAPLGYSVVSWPGGQLLTGASGKFLLRGVGPGQVKITLKHIGYGPRDTTITVGSRDTVRLDMTLGRLVIQLPEML